MRAIIVAVIILSIATTPPVSVAANEHCQTFQEFPSSDGIHYIAMHNGTWAMYKETNGAPGLQCEGQLIHGHWYDADKPELDGAGGFVPLP